jgi:hypothetical protein
MNAHRWSRGKRLAVLGVYTVRQAAPISVVQRGNVVLRKVGRAVGVCSRAAASDDAAQATSRRRRQQTGQVKHISSRIGDWAGYARTYEIRQHKKVCPQSPADAEQLGSNSVRSKLSNPASRWLMTCEKPESKRDHSVCLRNAINPQRRARSCGRSQHQSW